MVTLLHGRYTRADIDDDAGTFVAENAGNRPSGSAPDSAKSSVRQMPVALTSISTSPAFELNSHDLERFSCLNGNGDVDIHVRSLT